jgi:hypothetical protein
VTSYLLHIVRVWRCFGHNCPCFKDIWIGYLQTKSNMCACTYKIYMQMLHMYCTGHN